MKKLSSKKSQSLGWLLALIAITAISVSTYLITFLIDSQGQSTDFIALVLQGVASGALAGLPEVIAGILGISITVVAIIVELASNRYTARITELFIESSTNAVVLGFFVVTGLLCIWVGITTSEIFIPKVGVIVTIFAVTVCMLLLLPYFAFVFNFLNPHNIIDRMAASVLVAISKGGAAKTSFKTQKYKKQAIRGIEQLADMARGAIENKDKVICMHAVNTLGLLNNNYVETKNSFDKSWFKLDSNIKENPDFVSMQNEILEKIEKKQYWLEMMILRQYQMLYGESLNSMRDINYAIAINTRKIATKAMLMNQTEIISLAIKFFNTYMRSTINARDVRTAYNVFNQYRLLAQFALEQGHNNVAIEIAERFKYYGQLSFSMGLAFILETAAYDLCSLNEMAFKNNVDCKKELLNIFLDVDKEAEEGHALEASLRGVRKAQIKLATFYLTQDADDFAKIIFNDMKTELPSRLHSIHEELVSIKSKEFWEISDRGINFDYLDENRRVALEIYFGWFTNFNHST